eukprot:TRINITY_DN6689_c0_g1_i1.p1 TRINITY_DN6689_c0_g1~~TRINITY_DN6689_c0_g1_i1.p1  ORF type:complete len:928 (-),score=271.17 TRINITY_DN6689_c0_g1_i1:247-2694(-)
MELLQELFSQSSQIHDKINDWVTHGLPPAEAEHEKFRVARRNLDQLYNKLSKATGERKDLIKEKEQKEQEYVQQGEKSYVTIVTALEHSKFNNINYLHQRLDGYHQFFKTGYEYLNKEKEKIDNIKFKSQEELGKAKTHGLNINKSGWLPEFMGVDSNRVFGLSLIETIERDHPPEDIIPFLDQSFKYLEEQGLQTTGLFRISPPKPALDALKDKIDKGVHVDIPALEDVHLVAGLIKLFLRELPTPLLTFELFGTFMNISDGPESEYAQRTKTTLIQLPRPNYVLFYRLIKLCSKILQYTDENKMNAENLSIVLCPSILYGKNPDPLTMVQDIQKANNLMTVIIKNFYVIFDDPQKSTTTTTKNSKNKNNNNNNKDKNSSSSKEFKLTIIQPTEPPFPFEWIAKSNHDVSASLMYYQQLWELFEGSFNFSNSVLRIENYSEEKLKYFNSTFGTLANACKLMLSIMRDYVSLFPEEIGKSILVTANELRSHLKNLIVLVKAVNSGPPQKEQINSLMSETKEFIFSALQMFLVTYRASQADELTQSTLICQLLMTELSNMLRSTGGTSENEVIIVVNNLQNYAYKFTSLLRARLSQFNDEDLCQSMMVVVEESESCIGQIFDEARIMIENHTFTLTDAMNEKLELLSHLTTEYMDNRHSMEKYTQCDMKLMIKESIEQLVSIMKQHSDDKDTQLVAESVLSGLLTSLNGLQSSYNDQVSPLKWMDSCVDITNNIANIHSMVKPLLVKVTDLSLRVALESYLSALNHFLVQFKICSVAHAFGISIAGYEWMNFVVPLKDFAFLTFPFVYNFCAALKN